MIINLYYDYKEFKSKKFEVNKFYINNIILIILF